MLLCSYPPPPQNYNSELTSASKNIEATKSLKLQKTNSLFKEDK